MLTTAPRGTNDLKPGEVEKWHYIEGVLRDFCSRYGYGEVRTPIFEHTELFQRGIGETTDVVEKEMYTFLDRGNRSITLRPEGTASTIRAYVEHKMYAQPQPTKLYYLGPMFRYDRPQAGRYRQFTQFGIEVLGTLNPYIDAEVILFAVHFFNELGLDDLIVNINTVGCAKCRAVYRQKLQEFLRPNLGALCEDCQSRFERNPLRILDCKNEGCRVYTQDAPSIHDALCDECREHFEGLKHALESVGISYVVNPNLVRGLDYYTKTVFEITYPPLGAQSTICGGGRYDKLVEECGGPDTPGIGFALGIERLIIALDKQGVALPVDTSIDVFVATIGETASEQAFKLLYDLRKAKIKAEKDYLGRSLKAQMKYADKFPAKFVAIIGDEEITRGIVTLREMATGEQNEVAVSELTGVLQTKLGIRQEEI